MRSRAPPSTAPPPPRSAARRIARSRTRCPTTKRTVVRGISRSRRAARATLPHAAERAANLDPEAAVVMLAEATILSFYAGDARGMVRTAERAQELSARGGSRASILAGLAHGMALVFAGAGERGAQALRDAVAQLEASDELRGDPYFVVWAALGPLWLRESEAGRGLYERAVELMRTRSALGALPELLLHVARDWATTDE